LGLGTFWGLGHFEAGTFCIWDILELGRFVLGHFVLGRFVLGRFVGAPFSNMFSGQCAVTDELMRISLPITDAGDAF
jgi:hypothetical protein